ncbi:DUF3034 family protein [Sphingobium algorifonticola]|uniref:DUF3034 family protein n=1 Tax=Sphingobium algorifonticola TaxID=2008318 RepID=A0A437J8Z7_9SPHN|nr:DUF3034 family protein [Sphingobium algorifonticola]RVT41979.1 DUF3034 family protein [Sphingobium algorifonticola]
MTTRCLTLAPVMAALGLATAPAAAEPLRNGGKLLLTNGISSIEGASGGGLTPWATIAGNETRDGIGASAHATIVELKDYDYQSAGISVGLFDRVELSFARQDFNTNEIGGALGLGNDYAFGQDIFGAKVKLAGDLVYDAPLMPAIAVGVQYKKSRNDAVVRLLGATDDDGIDYYLSATKLFLSRSILVNATVRLTKANQNGLLGYGGDRNDDYSVQFEGSMAWQLSRRLAIGGEYRTKPNNLGVAKEDDWFDAFAAYAVNRHLTATVAYADLGSIATIDKQRGVLFSLQAAF